MDQRHWTRPVLIERFGSPGVLAISSVEEAAHLMLRLPSDRRSAVQLEALCTFRDVLARKASSALARANFIDAILEAGYYVLPESFIELRNPHAHELERSSGTQPAAHFSFRYIDLQTFLSRYLACVVEYSTQTALRSKEAWLTGLRAVKLKMQARRSVDGTVNSWI